MKHKTYQLKFSNGLRGLLVGAPRLHPVYISLVSKGGFYACPGNKQEIAHLMEHMIFQGNKKLPERNQLRRTIQKDGAYMGASTNEEDVVYRAQCSVVEWQKILKLWLQALSGPLFRQQDIEIDKKIVKEELLGYYEQNQYLLKRAMQTAQHNYNFTLEDRLQTINNINIKDIRQFHQRTHSTSNLHFVITANQWHVTKHRLRRIFKNAKLPTKPKKPVADFDYLFQKQNQAIIVKRPQQDGIFFRLEFVQTARPDLSARATFLIIQRILTYPGGRINSRARDQGLTYTTKLRDFPTTGSYSLIFEGRTQAANAESIFEIIVSELKKLLNGKIDDQEIEEAQNQIVGAHNRDEITGLKLHEHYKTHYSPVSDSVEEYGEIFEEVADMSTSEFKTNLKKFFSKRSWYLGLLGKDAEDLKGRLYKQCQRLF